MMGFRYWTLQIYKRTGHSGYLFCSKKVIKCIITIYSGKKIHPYGRQGLLWPYPLYTRETAGTPKGGIRHRAKRKNVPTKWRERFFEYQSFYLIFFTLRIRTGKSNTNLFMWPYTTLLLHVFTFEYAHRDVHT